MAREVSNKMKKINVEIKGISPLLMNNPASMMDETDGIRIRTKKFNHEEEAKKLLYKMKNGNLYIPSEAIKGTLIGGASYKKIGKFSARPMIAGGVFISPQEVDLKTKKYDLDIRTVVIQRNRVVKARPKIENWKASFEIEYNEKLIGNSEIIKSILIEAGERVGLLDFRPQKLGSFGRFEVTKWQEK